MKNWEKESAIKCWLKERQHKRTVEALVTAALLGIIFGLVYRTLSICL
jgi:hypothetical protein